MVKDQAFVSQADFRRTIAWAIFPPLLLLAAEVALLAILLMFWLNSSQWVSHTDAVIAGVNDIERLLVNMDTGNRGYLLTKDPDFLKPFLVASPRVQPAIRELRDLVTDNDVEVQRLDEISKAAKEWLALQPELVGPNNDVASPAKMQEVIHRRKVLMDQMRGVIGTMIRDESSLKSERRMKEERNALIAILGSLGLSVVVAVGLAWTGRRTAIYLATNYQKAMDAQLTSNRQFGELAEAIPHLVWISDEDGKASYFNDNWTEYAGPKFETLVSDGWLSMVHPEDCAAAGKQWQESIQTGKHFESEYRLKRTSDGTYRWFLCRATPVLDKDGKRIKWFGSCTDIEHKRQLEARNEEALASERKARSDLIRASRLKDEFLATLSHELRTPMTAILGWARLLKDPLSREKNLDRAIESIDANATVQARLIDDLLDMSRIISGKLPLKIEAVDLGGVANAAIDTLRPAAANKEIALSIQCAPHKMEVMGDPGRLQQVVWNLLSNAVKFTPKSGRVTVECMQVGTMARVVVSDTGQGIEPTFLPFVFDRFRQGDGTITRRYGGLGLGLAIAKNLMELHGGTISVASEGIGKGAVFTMELPLATRSEIPSDPIVEKADDRDVTSYANALVDRRVLVVDDDPTTALVVGAMLEHAGMQTVQVNSAALALERLKEESFDLIISDIGMPEMDGYTLIKKIREREQSTGRRIRAIALSAFARAEDRTAAIQAGFDLHLAKPLTPDDLYRNVATVLDSAAGGTSGAS